MGIFGKLKNIFYDEVEVPENTEVNRQKKEIQEIKKPVIEELKFDLPETEKKVETEKTIKTSNTFSERDLFKPERTFNFTEFDEEEEIKPRANAIELERRNKKSYSNNNITLQKETPKVIQPKVFKPSPVISPIYGILNKDYKKENVKDRTSNSSFELSSEPRTYDSVRRKAYGTLEDTLTDTMVTVKTEEITTTVNNIDKEIDALEKTAKLEKIISEIEKSTDVSVGELEDKAANIAYEEETTEINLNNDFSKDNTLTDNTLENDLFNLIDSMYDDKEE